MISSTYLHNVNSVAMLFKLLPLFCSNNGVSWRNKKKSSSSLGSKSKVLIFDERLLAAKILQNLRDRSCLLQISLLNKKVLEFQEVPSHKVVMKIGAAHNNTTMLDSDVLFIL